MEHKVNELHVPNFSGPIGPHLLGFLQEKRAVGYKYCSEASRLAQIDKLSRVLNINSNALPLNLVEEWCEKTPNESNKTWRSRITVMNQLIDYFIAHDLETHKTSIAPPQREQSKFVPHIFTKQELRRIFFAADHLKISAASPARNDTASLLFRILYACGLRISEALNLTMDKVDNEAGIFTIVEGKNKTERYVPMALPLIAQCRSYCEKYRLYAMAGEPLFAAPDGGHYSKSSITHMWSQILHDAKISKTDTGPRIHDFRHTCAVGCLKKWIREGKDLNAMLPILSAYLGHKNLAATQRYLRLTAEVYPEVTSMLEMHFGGIIPQGGLVCAEE